MLLLVCMSHKMKISNKVSSSGQLKKKNEKTIFVYLKNINVAVV